MTSNCPECGAHLSIVHAHVGRSTIPCKALAPQPRDLEYPSGVPQGSPNLDSGRDHLDSVKDNTDSSQEDLRRLKRLICPCPCFGGDEWAKQLTLRPYLCVGAVGVVKPGRPRETLDRTAIKMQAAICRGGGESAGALLTSRRIDRSQRYWQRPARMERVFQAIGAIIYDMEWTSDDGEPEFSNAETLADATNTIGPYFELRPGSCGCSPVVELMLLVDYGFPADPLFKFLDSGWSPSRSKLSRRRPHAPHR